MIYSVIKFQKPIAEKKEINLHFEPSESDVNVYADINMITTVLRNLISNAIKFTRRKGDIRIILSNKEEIAEISIIDNGVGIPVDKIPYLFKIEKSKSLLKRIRVKFGFRVKLIKVQFLVLP